MKNDPFKIRHRNINRKAYTRKEYVRKIPEGKLTQMKFTYGDENQPFQHELKLVSLNEKYISLNSLDAVRVALNHLFENKAFFLKILAFPHHITREHGLMGVQKAERLAKGMRHSFGRSGQRVALVNVGQTVIILRMNEIELGKKGMVLASKKLKPEWKIIADRPEQNR